MGCIRRRLQGLLQGLRRFPKSKKPTAPSVPPVPKVPVATPVAEVPVATPVAEPIVVDDGEEQNNWKKKFKTTLAIQLCFIGIGAGVIVATGGGALGPIVASVVLFYGVAFVGSPIALMLSNLYHSA